MGRRMLVSVALLLAFVVPTALAVGGGTASEAFMRAERTMCDALGGPMSDDADADFARMMKAHHQGAIEMARVELEHGTDPGLRAMAQGIIEAQTREIDELDAWLRSRKGTR